ncbi:MAG: hypothetical protein QF473_33870, partial [Planctomycetota bacterium]|nr:hypothetical protein [Planctomycetota bacterium]
HSKIHTHLTQSQDGRIYFGTHTGHPNNFYEGAREFEGGHFMSFDPRTGGLSDYGVGMPGDSLMRVIFDEPRGMLYGVTYPKGHLLLCNPKTHAITDLGKAAVSTYSTPWVMWDKKVYFASRPSEFSSFDPDTRTMKVLPLKLPKYRGEKQTLRFGCFCAVSPDRKKLYGWLRQSGQLVEWDLSSPPGRIRCLGGHGGSNDMAFSLDGRAVYFQGNGGEVCKYDFETKKFYAMGILKVGEERMYSIWGSCTAPDGTLFFGGNLSVGWKRSRYGLHGLTSFFEYDPSKDSERQREIWSETLPGRTGDVPVPKTAKKNPFERPDQVLRGVDLNEAAPYGESATRAMARLPGGDILIATEGKRSHLLRIDAASETVHDLGLLPTGEFPSYGGLLSDSEGSLYLCTIGDIEAIYRHKEEQTGNIFRIEISKAGNAMRLKKIAAPFKGEGIYCAAIGLKGKVIYGLTFPGGRLFACEIETGKLNDFGPVIKKARPSHFEHPGRYRGNHRRWTFIPLGRALAFDASGTLYGGAGGKLFKLRPGEEKPSFLKSPLPLPGGDRGEFYSKIQQITHGSMVLDALIAGGDGKLYGGTRRGYVFRLEPDTDLVVNLGKPLRQARIRSLCRSEGALYGLGGEEFGRSALFRYRADEGFTMRAIPAALSGYFMHFFCNHYNVVLSDPGGGLWLGGVGRMTDALKIRLW